jgi:(p)ppGpp synthase/HD superfamily hydrolase
MSTLERAIEIAARAHAGRVDKAGAPYLLHPLRVMLRLDDPEARIAAVLHDVVEDSTWTIEQLRAEGFTPEVLAAVDALTHRHGEPYLEYVRRAGQHALARRVKLADLDDNLDLSRIATPTDRDLARLEKYHQARALLTSMSPTA